MRTEQEIRDELDRLANHPDPDTGSEYAMTIAADAAVDALRWVLRGPPRMSDDDVRRYEDARSVIDELAEKDPEFLNAEPEIASAAAQQYASQLAWFRSRGMLKDPDA